MLPFSKLNVVNQALIELGKLPVENIAESEWAQLISTKVDLLLPMMLKDANWNFAVKYRSDSTPITQNFTPDLNYTYQLPADFGRFFKFSTNCFPLRYEFFDNYLVSNVYPIQYYYIVNNLDYSAFETLFFRALSIYAASDCCTVLTNNTALTQELRQKYLDAKSNAILFNDMQREITQTPFNDFNRQSYI